jgi:hypothetical protein
MDLWLPGYEHDPVQGAGLSVGPGRPKAVVHTTETGPGSLQFLIAAWRRNWGAGLPHFVSEGERYVQLLPLNVGAYTLENAPGGADTNRSGPAIQVEIITYAAKGLNDVEVEALGKWLADLVKAGVDLDLTQHPRFYGANEGIVLASYNSPIRMGAAEYQAFNGFCGHQHCPENAHWDPGKLDAIRVERIARYHLAPDPINPPFPDTPLEDPMTTPACYSGQRPQDEADGVWGDPGDGRLRRVPGPDVLGVLQAKKVLPTDVTACDANTLVGIVDFYNYDPPGVD